MLLVLLLSYVNLFQRTLLLSPRRMFHFRFILESGCKSTNFTTNFQIFFKKSFRNLQKLIQVKGEISFLVHELTSSRVDKFRIFLKHVNNAAIYIQQTDYYITLVPLSPCINNASCRIMQRHLPNHTASPTDLCNASCRLMQHQLPNHSTSAADLRNASC